VVAAPVTSKTGIWGGGSDLSEQTEDKLTVNPSVPDSGNEPSGFFPVIDGPG